MSVKDRFRRLYMRFLAKMLKEKASPEYIARGWAIGMFFGCLIPFGFQLLCSIPTAFLLKGSKIGATFGTLLTNHFTIFIIYPVQCYVGNHLIGGNLTYERIRDAMEKVLANQDYQTLFGLGWDLVISFFIGAAILTAVTTPITYWGVLTAVRRHRANKAARAKLRESRV